MLILFPWQNSKSACQPSWIYSFCQIASIDWPNIYIDYVSDTVEKIRIYTKINNRPSLWSRIVIDKWIVTY